MKTTEELTNFEKAIKAIATILYWNSPISLVIHFAINLALAQFFAHLYAGKLHADELTTSWILLGFRSFFVIAGISVCRKIETYGGELVECFGVNTHVVVKNGYWPMILFPLLKFVKGEHVELQKTGFVIPSFITTDVKGLGFEIGGDVRWEVGDTADDAAKFTETDEKFYEMMVGECTIAADSIVKMGDFRLATSILRDSTEYNKAVIAKMDPVQIRSEFGIVLKKGILKVKPTEKTMEVLAWEMKSGKFKDQIDAYMAAHNCSFAEATKAVNSALNGATVIDSNGAMPIINIGGTGLGRP